MTLSTTLTTLHSVYPIPPVSRPALSVIIAEPAALDEAEAAIKVALAMQYALTSGAFSARIIKLLRANVLGIKQYELANRLSYSPAAVSAWELGTTPMPADAYIALVDLVRARLDRNIELQRMGANVRERLSETTESTDGAESE